MAKPLKHTAASLGEAVLLSKIADLARPPRRGAVLLGPGDDCAAVRFPKNKVLLATSDDMVEGTHFLEPRADAGRLAAKLLRINLSDLAGMGDTNPVCVLCSASFPADTPAYWLEEFVRTLARECRLFNAPLAGGNLSRGDKFHLSITAIGAARSEGIIRRSGARPGDLLFTLGSLGEAKAGLELYYGKSRKVGGAFRGALLNAFWRPEPLFKEARVLARKKLAVALMDNSDGLYKSAVCLSEAGNCGAEIFLNDNCASPVLSAYCRKVGADWRAYALSGGEDYGLVFAVPPGKAALLRRTLPQARLVGKFISGTGVGSGAVDAKPYEHF